MKNPIIGVGLLIIVIEILLSFLALLLKNNETSFILILGILNIIFFIILCLIFLLTCVNTLIEYNKWPWQ